MCYLSSAGSDSHHTREMKIEDVRLLHGSFPFSLTQTPYYSHLSLFSLYWSLLHLGCKRDAFFTILNVCHKNTADPKLYDQSVIEAGRYPERHAHPNYIAPEEDNNQARHFPPTLSISRTWYVKHGAPPQRAHVCAASEPSPYLEQKSPLSNVCQDLSNLDRVIITP